MSEPTSSHLPLTDYDVLSVGDIEHRVRSLSTTAVEQLLAYEREHAARTPVVRVLMSRLSQLEAGSEPSPGGEAPPSPEQHRGTSPVSPATARQPAHPPPHGTADQPGKPKGDERP